MRRAVSALLILALAVSGCSIAKPETATTPVTEQSESVVTSVTEAPTTATTTEDPTPTPTPEPEPYPFNPHVHSGLLEEAVKEEWWDSFYNMCDAMREGRDSFECLDEDAYRWCTNEATLGEHFPAACTLVVGDGYKDGEAKLKYKIDKESFATRQSAFEEEVVRMVNDAVRSD